MRAMVATIYVQPGCRFCDMAKEFLSSHGIPYVERDISVDESAVHELRRLGTLAVPIILLNGRTIIGFNPEQLSEAIGE